MTRSSPVSYTHLDVYKRQITDGEGFVANLKDHGIGVEGKDIVIFGAGGAATAIQVQCALDEMCIRDRYEGSQIQDLTSYGMNPVHP